MQKSVYNSPAVPQSRSPAVPQSRSPLFRLLAPIVVSYRNFMRYPIRQAERRRLTNKNFSIISRDCVGTLLLHELGIRFDTPTINLFLSAGDFLKFCLDIKYYLSCDMLEDKEEREAYPVGILGNEDKIIKIRFVHYKNFAEAKEKWKERALRIHWDNMYFIMTDGVFSSDDIVRGFDALPYEHKALLTYRDIPGVKSAVKLNVKHMDKYGGIAAPSVFEFKSLFSLWRVIDDWDYIDFLNS